MKQEKPNAYEIVARAERLVGTKQIAERLKVSEDMVRTWCQGGGSLSDTHLLRLADLLARYAEAHK